jgi:hypothetical protein
MINYSVVGESRDTPRDSDIMIKKESAMEEKIWWKCNGCCYLLQRDVGKDIPKPYPACMLAPVRVSPL